MLGLRSGRRLDTIHARNEQFRTMFGAAMRRHFISNMYFRLKICFCGVLTLACAATAASAQLGVRIAKAYENADRSTANVAKLHSATPPQLTREDYCKIMQEAEQHLQDLENVHQEVIEAGGFNPNNQLEDQDFDAAIRGLKDELYKEWTLNGDRICGFPPVVGDLNGDIILDGSSSGGKVEQRTETDHDPSGTSSFTQRWFGIDGRVRARIGGTAAAPMSFVAGVKALWFSGGSTTLALNFPTGTTSLTYQRDGYVLPYVGLSFPVGFGGMPAGLSVVPYMGLRYEWGSATFTANETAIGGRINTVSNRVNGVGLTFGSELEAKFGSLAGAAVQPFARVGTAVDVGLGRKTFGVITTGNGYFNSNNPQTSYRVYAGIGLSFGAR